ncbi:MAG TPA: hypothetical protein VL728_06400 [Cyclobacteriaceae bacterium]|jgi:hypothetical protein|nr:hypothetical protein [Cyclobacteriaceae bacterium]
MEKLITDDDLLNFLDGMGSEDERKNFERLVNENQVAQKRLRELQAVHYFLRNQKGIEQPSKNFTEKVMDRLHTKPSFTFFSPKNGLILLAGLLVASVLALMLASSGAFDQLHTVFSFKSLPGNTNLIKIPTSVPFDIKVFVKVFVLINLVVGFFLLDRTILRPIFQKRSERLSL